MVITLLILTFTSIAATTWHDRQVVSEAHIIGATDLSRVAVQQILDSCLTEERRQLSLSNVRDRIETIPFVRDASVYFSDVRGLTAEIRERTPVAHVVMDDGTLRYVDAAGIILPYTTDHVSDCLPVIRGVRSPLVEQRRVQSLVSVLMDARSELDPCLYEELSEVVEESDGTVKVLTNRVAWRLGKASSGRSRDAFADMNTFWKAVARGSAMASVREVDLRWKHSVVLLKGDA